MPRNWPFLCLTVDCAHTCTTVSGWRQRPVEGTCFSLVLIHERSLVIVWDFFTVNCVLQPPGLYYCIENGKCAETFWLRLTWNNRSFMTTEFYGYVWCFQNNNFHRFLREFYHRTCCLCSEWHKWRVSSLCCFTLNPLCWSPIGQLVSHQRFIWEIRWMQAWLCNQTKRHLKSKTM